MATNMAEALKFAAKPTSYDSDERTLLEFRFKLENYLALVNEEVRTTSAGRRILTCGECSSGN